MTRQHHFGLDALRRLPAVSGLTGLAVRELPQAKGA